MCDPHRNNDVATGVAEVGMSGSERVCTREGPQGKPLETDGQQWSCWLEHSHGGAGAGMDVKTGGQQAMVHTQYTTSEIGAYTTSEIYCCVSITLVLRDRSPPTATEPLPCDGGVRCWRMARPPVYKARNAS